jgi:hypothetical protein
MLILIIFYILLIFDMNFIKKYIITFTLLCFSFSTTINLFGQASITSPASGQSYTNPVPVSLTIPASYNAGSLKLIFSSTSGNFTNTIVLKNGLPTGTLSFTFSTTSISNSNISSTTSTTLPDDTYNLKFQYSVSSNTFSTTQTNVIIKTSTYPGFITSPVVGTVYSSTSTPTFAYTLMSAPLPGTVMMHFENVSGSITNFQLGNQTSGSILSPSNTLADGNYTCTVSYRDYLNNPEATSPPVIFSFDRNTLTPSLTYPTSLSTISGYTSINYVAPEAILPGSKIINISQNGTVVTTLTVSDTNTGTVNLNLNLKALSTFNPAINSVSGTYSTSIPDGTYSITFAYRDSYGNPESSITNPDITIRSVTPTPTLTIPTSGSVIASYMLPAFTYNLPSAPLSGTAILTLSPGYTYHLANLSGTNTYTLTTNIPPDGTYTATVTYLDYLGNPAASSTPNSITFDSQTLAPSFSTPLNNSINTGTITFTYSLPEPAMAGSKSLMLSQNGTTITSINLRDNDNGTVVLNLKDLTSSSNQYSSISGTNTTNIADGTYSATIYYMDANRNPAANSSINFTIDSYTIRIPISFPLPNTTVTNNLNLKFTLPEAVLSGSLKLHLTSTTNDIFYTLANLTPNTYDWTINPSVNLLVAYPQQFTSVSPSTFTNIPVGTYTLTMIYQDALGNRTDSGMYMTNIKIDNITALPPVILSPKANALLSNSIIYNDSLPIANFPGTKKLYILKNNAVISTLSLNDKLKDTIYFDTHHLTSSLPIGATLNGADSLSDGTYVLKLSYQDIYANPTQSTTDTLSIDTSPFIGVLSHTNNIVYGTFTETLTFNKPVNFIGNNGIIPNIINNNPGATIGTYIPNTNKTIYTFSVNPLQQGILKLQSPYMGLARDLAGNLSQVISIDSVQYVDTTQILTPLITGLVSFCNGDSVTLSSSIANTYLWSTGATTRTIVVKLGGTYNVKTTYDNHVKGISTNLTVTSNPIPSAPIISRDANNNLVSSAQYGNVWYLNGINTNDTSNTIKPAQAGPYAARTIQSSCASAIGANYYYVITDIENISAT